MRTTNAGNDPEPWSCGRSTSWEGCTFSDGTSLSVVTGLDDNSRFCVIAKLVARATAKPVCDALIEALTCHGIPEQILTDNGRVFTGKLNNKPANVLFDRICLNNGIKHILTESRAEG